MKFPYEDVDLDNENLRMLEDRPFTPFGNIANKIKVYQERSHNIDKSIEKEEEKEILK